jgi:hypothetical protein
VGDNEQGHERQGHEWSPSPDPSSLARASRSV